MKNITDRENYYLCKTKIYKAKVCMPLAGTCVLNRFEHQDLIWQVGKEFITAIEMDCLFRSNPGLFIQLYSRGHVVNACKPFVIAGTRCELNTLSLEELYEEFVMDNGNDITMNEILLRGRSLNGCDLKTVIPHNGWYMDWTTVEKKRDNLKFAMACFIPVYDKVEMTMPGDNKICINSNGIQHGDGDYIVCDISKDNVADTTKMEIVNGLVFTDTYECDGLKHTMAESFSMCHSNLYPVI